MAPRPQRSDHPTRRLLPLVAVLLLAGGCDGFLQSGAEPAPSVVADLSLDTLVDETNSAIEEPERRLIRSPAEWEAFHDRIYASREPAPERPPVDFDSHVVAAAAMGTRPTGGHAIAVDSAAYAADTLTVVVREVSPGESCMVTQALTRPVQAVRVPVTGVDALETVEVEEVRACE